MATDSTHYYLPAPSRWPVTGSTALFLMAISAVLLVNGIGTGWIVLAVGAAILMLVHFGRAPILPALIILCREILVSGLREFLAQVQVGLPVSRLAKWKTAVQMTAIGFLLAGPAAPALAAAEIGWYGLWLAAILTMITGLDYLYAGLRHSTTPAPAKRPAGRPATVR